MERGIRHSATLRARAVARRLFWAALLLLHVGAIRSVWGALQAPADTPTIGADLLRLATLIFSSAFFLLKIADVPWLRLRPGWQSWVASVLIVTVIHVNAVGRAVDRELPLPASGLGVVLFIGTLADPEAIRRGLFVVARHLRQAASAGSARPAFAALGRRQRWSDFAPSPEPLLASGLIAPRPPPFAQPAW